MTSISPISALTQEIRILGCKCIRNCLKKGHNSGTLWPGLTTYTSYTSTGHKDKGIVQQVSSRWHEKLWEQFEWQHYTNRPTIHPTDRQSAESSILLLPPHPLTSLFEGTINQLYKRLGPTRTSIPSSHGLLTLLSNGPQKAIVCFIHCT